MEKSKIIYLNRLDEKENIDDLKDREFITPTDIIRNMYDYADERGSVIICDCILDSHYNEIEYQEQYTMNWSKNDVDKAIEKYEKLYADIKKITSTISYGQLNDNTVDVENLPTELCEVWKKYICRLKVDEGEISDEALRIKEKRACCEPVLKDEQLLFDRYISMAENEAVSRIGKGYEAGMVICRARRLCSVMCLGAPEMVTVCFAKQFAAALTIHQFCSSATIVSISSKLHS